MNQKVRENSIRFIVLNLLTVFILIILPNQLQASNTQMRLHAIYLTDGANGTSGNSVHGEAVLLESGGEYLLMDMGHSDSYASVKYYLTSIGITKNTKLSLYISHWHGDHTGGTQENQGFHQLMKDFNIQKVYLPDPSIYSKINVSGHYQNVQKYFTESYPDEDLKEAFVYLKRGSSFRVGNAVAQVLGPVNPVLFPVSTEDAYINNCSLVTKITSGGISYLTAGDIRSESENQLIAAYGTRLCSTIYKMSHHGLPSSNSSKFVSYVKPSFSFETNMQLTENKVYGTHGQMRRRTYTSCYNCSRFGMVYMLGDEKQTCILEAYGGQVKLYRRDNAVPINSNGWARLIGGDGVGTFYSQYYCINGVPVKGVQNINGNIYYMGTGGCMETGHYVISGGVRTYKGFRTYDIGNGRSVKRYYQEGTNIMLTGYQVINGKAYYFRNDGTLITGDANWSIQTINGSRYAVYTSGVLSTGTWRKIGSGYCYFGNDSKQVIGGGLTLDGKQYYIDPSTGYRVTGIRQINKKKYYFSKKGVLQRHTCINEIKGTYYANAKGVLQSGWIKLNGARYYMNPLTNFMSTGLTQIDNKIYYFDANGILQVSQKIKLKGFIFQTDRKGIIYNIEPTKKANIKKVVGKHKKAVVRWKMSENAGGYQVYISESKTGIYKPVATVKGRNVTKAVIKNLEKGKTYYVKVAAYHKIAGAKLYASAGKAQMVKVR